MNDLTYTDNEGNKLYGFSQISMDKQTEAINKQTFWIKIGSIVGVFVVAYVLWLTWYVISKGVVNNIVARCVG